MNRKQFIKSQGATCQNWTWSWSFVNEKDQVIIFGAWNRHTRGNTSLILSEDWEISRRGRKQPAYTQSREHIRLVEEGGYQLKTFPMQYSSANEEDGIGPAKIEGFTPELTLKSLMNVGNNWYAFGDEPCDLIPEEVVAPEQYIEGASQQVTVNQFERCAEGRAKCIEHYGYECAVCSFDFERFYGDIGKNYMHVHHVFPLSDIRKEYILNPITDLVPVCPNCHAIIHRTRPALSVEKLKKHLNEKVKTLNNKLQGILVHSQGKWTPKDS